MMPFNQPFFLIFFLCFISSAPLIGQSDLELLLNQEEVYSKKYDRNDIQDFIITDDYISRGIHHKYFQQSKNGIPIYGSSASLHSINGKIISHNIKFLPGIKNLYFFSRKNFTAQSALAEIARQKGLEAGEIQLLSNSENKWKLFAPKIANDEIHAQLIYYPVKKNELDLCYEITLDHLNGGDLISYFLHAYTGEILHEEYKTIHCTFDNHVCSAHNKENIISAPSQNSSFIPNSYNVLAWPLESPHAGGRTLEINPQSDNPTASPNGWHSYNGSSFTTSRGNNVDAYEDSNDSDNPTGGDAARAEGGSDLEFDFPWDPNGTVTDYKDAAVTNLFYWTNVLHDVLFNYGFDEASGNFQQENFTPDGQDGDYCRSEAQDGQGTCNANFSTFQDGNRPRMQMYLCGNRDGSFDNGVVIHEYGHGVSNRLTGGPSASGCLGNQEQMGEGWSDYLATVLTIEAGDLGPDERPMGLWLFGYGPNGNGIRPYPYSTDMNVNPMTYASSFSGVSVPHGVGSVWATMLWDMTWALIDQYGWDADIYNGSGGNNIALNLVMEGMKLQPCSPGFVDGRDAILAADLALYNGDHQCLIWEAFANRGLGFSANQGSSNSRSDGTEAFDMPPSCTIELTKTANVSQTNPGSEIQYNIKIKNVSGDNLTNVIIQDDLPLNTIYVMSSNGGSESGGVVTWPSINLNDGDSVSVSLTVEVDPLVNADIQDFVDNMESGSALWEILSSGSTDWNLQDTVSNSGDFAWFANDGGSPGVANLTTEDSYGISTSSKLTFSHRYDTEATWDGGLVFISVDEGNTWIDLGDDMTNNGYNSTIYNSFPGFSGNSNGFISTQVNLSAYAGQNAYIRFQMICDQYVDGNGWFIDDVMLDDLMLFIPNKASVSDGNINSVGFLNQPTLIEPNCAQGLVTASSDNTEGSLRDIISKACDGDTIFFDPSLNGLDIQIDQGEIQIDKDLIIIGLGVNNISLNGLLRNRIFKIQPGVVVEIQALKIINGLSPNDGGGILNEGLLTLKNVWFENNFSGGIFRSITNLGSGELIILENVTLKE